MSGESDGTALGRFIFWAVVVVMAVVLLPVIVAAELWTRLRHPEYRWVRGPACLMMELEGAIPDDV